MIELLLPIGGIQTQSLTEVYGEFRTGKVSFRPSSGSDTADDLVRRNSATPCALRLSYRWTWAAQAEKSRTSIPRVPFVRTESRRLRKDLALMRRLLLSESFDVEPFCEELNPFTIQQECGMRTCLELVSPFNAIDFTRPGELKSIGNTGRCNVTC
jgi:hypothetical protein